MDATKPRKKMTQTEQSIEETPLPPPLAQQPDVSIIGDAPTETQEAEAEAEPERVTTLSDLGIPMSILTRIIKQTV